MSEFTPLSRLEDMAVVDVEEAYAGYAAAVQGAAEPLASYYSRSFWHGWRRGCIDCGRAEPDAPMRQLLSQCVVQHELPQ